MTTGLLLVVFLAIAVMIGAIGWVAARLCVPVAMPLRIEVEGRRAWHGPKLRKLPKLRPADEPARWSPARRIDDWFERFVAGTGLGWRAETVFLLTVASGLLCGGVPFLVWENPFDRRRGSHRWGVVGAGHPGLGAVATEAKDARATARRYLAVVAGSPGRRIAGTGTANWSASIPHNHWPMSFTGAAGIWTWVCRWKPPCGP